MRSNKIRADYYLDLFGLGISVSVNSFVDTLGPKIRRPQPRYTVAHISPGQGLYIHADQSARLHCTAAETHAVPSGVLPRYQTS